MTKDEALKLAKAWFERNTYADEAVEVYEAIEQALAAPVQEPVGYWLIGTNHVEFDKHEYHNGTEWEAIYTTPPAAQRSWVGLTVEEIADEFYKFEAAGAWYQFARAIEAKLKEKNT